MKSSIFRISFSNVEILKLVSLIIFFLLLFLLMTVVVDDAQRLFKFSRHSMSKVLGQNCNSTYDKQMQNQCSFRSNPNRDVVHHFLMPCYDVVAEESVHHILYMNWFRWKGKSDAKQGRPLDVSTIENIYVKIKIFVILWFVIFSEVY